MQGPIDGGDAALVAAYLELRLDEWERAAFEGRLVDEPHLLDALIAAREALQAPPVAVPQAVTAFALNLAPRPPTRRQPVARAPAATTDRRRFAFWPLRGAGLAYAASAFLAAFAAGAVLTWQLTAPEPMTAQKEKDAEKDRLPGATSPLEEPVKTNSGTVPKK